MLLSARQMLVLSVRAPRDVTSCDSDAGRIGTADRLIELQRVEEGLLSVDALPTFSEL